MFEIKILNKRHLKEKIPLANPSKSEKAIVFNKMYPLYNAGPQSYPLYTNILALFLDMTYMLKYI